MFNSLLKFAPVQVFSSLSVFFLIAIQTRYLSVEEYGALTILMVMVEVSRAYASQWVSTSLLRLYPSASVEERKKLAPTGMLIIYGLCIPAILVFFALLINYEQYGKNTWIVISFLLVCKSVFLYHVDLARLTEKVQRYRKAVLTQSGLGLLLSFIFLEYSPTVNSAILALLISYILGAIWVRSNKVFSTISWTTASRFFKYGGPLLVAGMLSTLKSRIDRFFIADYLGLADTGTYAAISSMLLGVMGLVFMIVAMPTYPDLARLTRKPTELKKAHEKYLSILLGVTLPSLIGLLFVAESMIRIFLTEEYIDSGLSVFYILAFSTYFINFKNHYVDHGLQFLLKTKWLMVVSALMLMTNVFLLLFLLKMFGTQGAAISSLIVGFISILATSLIANMFGYQYSINLDSIKVMISSAIMGGGLFIEKHFQIIDGDIFKLAVSVITGVLLYGSSLIVLNTFGFRNYLVNRLQCE